MLHCYVFVSLQVDEQTRTAMYRLRRTWVKVIPNNKLFALDVSVKRIDPAWPITAKKPDQASIHVNPKFLASQVMCWCQVVGKLHAQVLGVEVAVSVLFTVDVPRLLLATLGSGWVLFRALWPALKFNIFNAQFFYFFSFFFFFNLPFFFLLLLFSLSLFLGWGWICVILSMLWIIKNVVGNERWGGLGWKIRFEILRTSAWNGNLRFLNTWGDTWRSGCASVTNASGTCGLWVRFRAPVHIFRLVCDSW
jgi:hypothetical protein